MTLRVMLGAQAVKELLTKMIAGAEVKPPYAEYEIFKFTLPIELRDWGVEVKGQRKSSSAGTHVDLRFVAKKKYNKTTDIFELYWEYEGYEVWRLK